MVVDEIRFDGRVAIVTGAGNGIGRAHALALAKRGASVVVNDLGGQVDGTGSSRASADAVVEEIRSAGGVAVASYESVATPQGGEAIVRTALNKFGKLDILINNAGILRQRRFTEGTVGELELTLATHVHGAVYVTQPAYAAMRAENYGRIVFTTSTAGLYGLPGLSFYGAAKGAVIGLMNAVAIEGREYGIMSNAISPGALTRMATSDAVPDEEFRSVLEAMAKLQTAMSPEFVTPLALFLVSEQCNVTRSIYSAIAGRFARNFIGSAKGWQGSIQEPSTPEDVARNWDIINELNGFIMPDDGNGELRFVLEN
ncbi:SDR family NAD(P)-dependent oxidoreductase [Aquisediminimonas profunda]|uniref:SDR family NAD(P)-dependent oxidoreductase n=1 Tax=Aquisediminimonas profunda TaxID=1550733 RepID=UPI001C62BFEF|nr:SDR family NAD(P)-dependent oxidoreductase [Aquisediminimonas profunda]